VIKELSKAEALARLTAASLGTNADRVSDPDSDSDCEKAVKGWSDGTGWEGERGRVEVGEGEEEAASLDAASLSLDASAVDRDRFIH